jgi:hypothetical protein
VGEKQRLEEKQRAKKKEMEKRCVSHEIKWFVLKKDEDGDEIYVSNHLYEDERKRGDWNHFPDIFC